jgi:hypothetical protein
MIALEIEIYKNGNTEIITLDFNSAFIEENGFLTRKGKLELTKKLNLGGNEIVQLWSIKNLRPQTRVSITT